MADQPPIAALKESVGPSVIVGMSAAIAEAGANPVITVTPPAALTTVDTVPIGPPGLSSVLWAVEAKKGTAYYGAMIRGQTNGTVANGLEYGVSIAPTGGTFDFVWSVAVSAGSMLLQITPSSTGWTIYAIRVIELPT